ncbi:hypothetical protein [Wolbachia endosymbiont (group A) of Rhinocyllus conicus]|uniref:hypothetical protein n=1 Tax=Wolbachia endosymbiont (group A) of Rhinocyllus conicus TaxID=2954053 RepID=UPI002225F620|nr:hypothetical protein [Wolbachia endosymbiont (group A) of Rhinocyllus conicus]
MFHSITQNPYSQNPMHYLQLSFLDPSGLCCIASYDGLKIKKMENISSLLFWYL